MTFYGHIGLFWGAALRKIPHGAWVPLMIGVILYVILYHWNHPLISTIV